MSQSLARLHVHLVFSTKHRAPLIDAAVRDALHAYLVAVLQKLTCPVQGINSVEDHVHILFDLSRTCAISEVVEQVKTSSSKWIKTRGRAYSGFAWQAGYGAFAVSESMVATVEGYLARQQEHHHQSSFQDEYRALLERHRITFDERYVWD